MTTRKILLTGVALATSMFGLAQTGPGGVGASGTNDLWLDAALNSFNTGTTQASNGQTVQTWGDLSGNSNDVSQSTASARPVFTTGALNGRPTITFDGTNDYLDGQIAAGNISNYEAFAVSRFSTATQGANDNDVLFLYGNSTNPNDRCGLIRTASNHPTGSNQYLCFKEGLTLSGPALNNSYHLFNQRITTTAPRHFFRLNGAAQAVTASTKTLNTANFITLGRFNYNAGLHHLTGDIAELIIFNTALNTTQVNIVENYLAAKYNLTIANDLYTHQAANGNEVAGIGQENATDNHTDAQGSSIVRINSANDLEDGEYMLWGHNGAGLGNNNTEVPAAYTNGQRLDQEWRVDISGGDNTVGTVTIIFDMTGIMFGIDPEDYRILIDSDNDGGDFTDATVDPTTPTVVGTTITFTGITLTDGDYFTIGNSNDVTTCLSLSTNNWQTVVWDCGATPDSSNNVIIGDGTTVTVATGTTESANDLDVGEGTSGTLVLGDNSILIVKGDLTLLNGSSMTFGDGATLLMRGVNGNQTIANNSGSALTIYNLEITNTNGVSTGAGTYEITSGLTLNRGNLTNNGTVTFLSTATETAHINPIPNGSILDGPGVYDVQRFRSGRAANWGNIASSGVDTDLEDLDGEIYMSGIPGGDGYAAAQGGGGFNSVWYWDATIDDYVEPNSTADAFLLGRGYEIWLADNLNTWNPQAWTLRGDIFVDPITLNVNSAGGGWNLLGNPYLGFLDWDQITTDNAGIVDGDYWYLDADLNAYASVSAGGGAFVPPGQGFWINTTGITTINLDPSSDLLSGENSPIFRKRPARKDELRVLLTNENAEFGSAAYLRENEFAYEGLDEFDLTPLRVPDARACHVAFEAGAQEVVVNYINTDQDRVELPFTVTSGMKGEFSLNFTGLDALENYTCAQLIDENGNAMDVIEDQPYALQIDQENTTISYTLVLSKTSLDLCDMSVDETMQSNVVVTVKDYFILIDYDLDQVAMSEVQVFNALGNRVITDQQAVSHARQILNANDLSTGVYFVNVEVNGQVSTHKIILQ